MGEWILNPSIVVFSPAPKKPSLLISETLDKLALIMEREGGAGGKGGGRRGLDPA